MESAPAHITRLRFISEILAERQIPVAYLPADEDTGELLLVTATIMDGVVVPLRLVSLNEIIPPASETIAPLTSWLLHASLVFPFHVPAEQTTEVMRATQLVSRVLPLCSLGVIEPEGAFYFLVDTTPIGLSSTNLAEKLLSRYKVATVPGIAFGHDKSIRFSYATSLDIIKKGLDRFEDFCKSH